MAYGLIRVSYGDKGVELCREVESKQKKENDPDFLLLFDTNAWYISFLPTILSQFCIAGYIL